MSMPQEKMSATRMEIRPITGALGCEIYNVDLAHLDDATFGAIHQAFLDYSAVMFHDQQLTQEQFAAFGRRFAKLEDEPFLPHKADVPGVYYLRVSALSAVGEGPPSPELRLALGPPCSTPSAPVLSASAVARIVPPTWTTPGGGPTRQPARTAASRRPSTSGTTRTTCTRFD